MRALAFLSIWGQFTRIYAASSQAGCVFGIGGGLERAPRCSCLDAQVTCREDGSQGTVVTDTNSRPTAHPARDFANRREKSARARKHCPTAKRDKGARHPLRSPPPANTRPPPRRTP